MMELRLFSDDSFEKSWIVDLFITEIGGDVGVVWFNKIVNFEVELLGCLVLMKN